MSCEHMAALCPTPQCTHPAKHRGECCASCNGQCQNMRLVPSTFQLSQKQPISYLCLFLQSVSMNRGCMLMGKFSALLGVDPACSAGVRQVYAIYTQRKCVSSAKISLFFHSRGSMILHLFHAFFFSRS